MNMGLVQQHWPLVHGKKHGKIPGKKGQAKHTYSGGGEGGSHSSHARLLLNRGDAHEREREGGWGVGGDDEVATEWSALSADATAPPIP